MHDVVCGRPIYQPSSAFRDNKPVCLMHSQDPEKNGVAFQKEFEIVLAKAGAGEADFSGFVFPNAVHWGDEFRAKCLFSDTTFVGAAIFDLAVFAEFADFSRAKFVAAADFLGANFAEGANFWNAKFEAKADFNQATFAKWVAFSHAIFAKEADFGETLFVEGANFSEARFSEQAIFASSTFAQHADFSAVTFAERVTFYNTAFVLLADFRVARFRGSTEFRETLFRGDSRLTKRLEAYQKTSKSDTTKPTREDPAPTEPGPVFSRANFEKPERVIFYQTDLGRALFHNCDISKVVFSDVEWLKRRRSGRSGVFDEIVDPNLGYGSPEITLSPAGDLKPGPGSSSERNYRLVSELYQRLERNYDSSGDYTTAGDFHHGKMEMKRLETKIRSQKLRWLKRNLGLVAWYKYASEYGESYVRPALWLLGMVFALGLLYPLLGLRYNGTRGTAVPLVLRYGSSCPDQSTDRTCIGPARLAGNGLMASLQTATFQKDFTYEPAYPWGKLLALIELLLVSTLVGLFLLAVRRQFKR